MVQDVSTRWNSTFQMLQRALKLRACIAVFCQTNNLEEKYGLTADEWKKFEQLCDFLEPLNEATDTISPEKTTSLVFGAPVYSA